MEEELRLSLLLLGGCFIVGVLAHGLWNIRKSNKLNQNNTQSRIEPDYDEFDEGFDDTDAASDNSIDEGYDELGLGRVKVVTRNEPVMAEAPTDNETLGEDEPNQEDDVEPAPNVVQQDVNVANEEKLYGAVVSNPKPHMQQGKKTYESQEPNEAPPEPPGFLLRAAQADSSIDIAAEPVVSDAEPNEKSVGDIADFSLDTVPSAAESAEQAQAPGGLAEQAKKLVGRRKQKPLQRKRQEPSFGDDQMHIDFDEPSAEQAAAPAAQEVEGDTDTPQQEVLVLNVRAAADEPISGAALLPMLLTLGFKFGDQDIFHRHVNANGKGPVLFSLANMFKPGVFDIDNLENFTTAGVSLFMILPIEGDAHQVFNMMHNAARKIADEFGAQVLDGRRSVLTKQGLQQYVEKIREFERKRMISRV